MKATLVNYGSKQQERGSLAHRLVVALAGVSALLGNLSPLTARAQSLWVVPRGFEAMEGGAGSGLLHHAIRLQQVYGAGQFTAGPMWIRELRLRPSAGYGGAFTARVARLVVRMSTTAVEPDRMSAVFAQNYGSEVVEVFAGSVELSSRFEGPAGGPKALDIRVPLSVPYRYDPGRGNLLVEWLNYQDTGVTFVDAAGLEGDRSSRAFALSAEAEVATTRDTGAEVLGLVWEPVEVPAEPPQIVGQPASQAVGVGQTAIFRVEATGTAPLSYQWWHEGAVLAGATAPVLVLSNVQPAQAGAYWVVVANAAGSVTSQVATLTVEVLGAKSALASVLAEVQALAATVTNRHQLDLLLDAIRSLGEALAPERWVDETHLVRKHGERVFNHAHEAVKKLAGLLKPPKGQIAEPLWLELMHRVASAARLLAMVSIQDAAEAGVKPKKLAEDLEQVAKGDLEAAQGDVAKAITHYRNAWKHAAHLKIRPTAVAGVRGLQVEFMGLAGQEYVIEASTDLSHWAPIGTCKADADGRVQFTDPDAAKYPLRFYRIVDPSMTR